MERAEPSFACMTELQLSAHFPLLGFPFPEPAAVPADGAELSKHQEKPRKLGTRPTPAACLSSLPEKALPASLIGSSFREQGPAPSQHQLRQEAAWEGSAQGTGHRPTDPHLTEGGGNNAQVLCYCGVARSHCYSEGKHFILLHTTRHKSCLSSGSPQPKGAVKTPPSHPLPDLKRQHFTDSPSEPGSFSSGSTTRARAEFIGSHYDSRLVQVTCFDFCLPLTSARMADISQLLFWLKTTYKKKKKAQPCRSSVSRLTTTRLFAACYHFL